MSKNENGILTELFTLETVFYKSDIYILFIFFSSLLLESQYFSFTHSRSITGIWKLKFRATSDFNYLSFISHQQIANIMSEAKLSLKWINGFLFTHFKSRTNTFLKLIRLEKKSQKVSVRICQCNRASCNSCTIFIAILTRIFQKMLIYPQCYIGKISKSFLKLAIFCFSIKT